MLAFLVAFQLRTATPTWTTVDSAKVAWRAGAPAYRLLLEDSVVPADSDPDHRIRIRVPGRPDFTVIDDRGPGGFLAVRASLRFADHALIPRDLPDSARVLSLPLRGEGGTAVIALFGYGYASNPDELVLIGFDRSGYPRLLFREEFDLDAVADLDGDHVPEIIGHASLSQGFGKCYATYDPFAVYRFKNDTLQYDLVLSRRYNEKHYVWGGPKSSEDIAVDKCTPGKLRLFRPTRPRSNVR